MQLKMSESMVGWHDDDEWGNLLEFRFDVGWTTRNLGEWLANLCAGELVCDMEGTVYAERITDCPVPIENGRMVIDYSAGYISYEFEFEVGGRCFRYIGEKADIRPMTLPRSHMQCFGEIIELKPWNLCYDHVAQSITYFRWRDVPSFIGSARIVL